MHIRVLWGLLSQDDIPPVIDGPIIQTFNERFRSSDDLRTHIENLISSVRPASEAALAAVVKVQRAALMGMGQIAKDVNRIKEIHLQTMFVAIADAGLNRWAPDVLGTVESMYNSLHEELAVSTFQKVAGAFAYTFMNVDLSFIKNYHFLVKLYRSFVFGYMQDKARREGKNAGRVAEDIERNNVYRRRDHVRMFTLFFLLQYSNWLFLAS